jgi:serine protease Do
MRYIKSTIFIALIGTILIVVPWVGASCEKSQPEGNTEKMESSEQTPPITTPTQLSQPYGQIVEPPLNLTTAIIQVAKSNIPAVVHIEVTERQEVPNPFFPFENSPFFRHYFGLPRKMPKKFERKLVGVGTGVIIDDQGHIVTNYHVVGGANKIQVTLSNGEEYPAKVIGTDPKTDLGVIQIPVKSPLVYATFGDSDNVQVGQWVVAIGQPRNLAQSVTQGIISAKHRTGITDPNGYQDFLQTDAAINPGNSGGPLLNLRGEVIGINSVILSQSGGFEGIGFAIPSNMAVHVADALIKNGKVERAWLGVSVQDVTPELAKSFGLKTPRGALIADVTKNAPAEEAGLKRGDVVLTYQGKDIPDAATLRNDVASTPIGQDVTVTVWRDRKKQEFHVKVRSLEELTKILTASLKERLGVEVRPLTVQDAEQYGMRSPEGVVIQWVEPKGPLGKVGFEVGDFILAVDDNPVQGLEDFDSMVSALPHNKQIVLLALDHRTGETTYVKVEVD